MHAVRPAEFPLPAHLGRYELLAKIAEGGMASVYLARLSGPMGFQRPVAIKLMKTEFVQSEEFVKMFLDEARLVARLSHPNIVQLLELGQDEGPIGRAHGGFFIVMECLMGESLLDTWYACQDRGLMLPYDVIAWIGARAAEGLHHAHELKDPMSGTSERIVHRDVNPGNIFLTYDGQIKVIDFGVAKALNRLSASTSAGTLKGKVAYMAPEQAKTSNVDRRADCFSLGVTLWELSTDRRLFKRKREVDTLIAVTETVVPDPTTGIPDYPADLWHVLRRALAGNRDNRFPTALEMSRDLDRVAQGSRAMDATVLAEVMNFLFFEQRNRYVTWLKQASAGDSSQVLRSRDKKRLDMQVASVDASPLSARAGQAIPIRTGSHPALPIQAPPQHPFGGTLPLQGVPSNPDGPTLAVQSPMQLYAAARPPNLPPPQQVQYGPPPQQPMQPYGAPPQQPMYAPAQAPPPSKTGSASNIVFALIAILSVLAIGGYFAYARFVHHPQPAPAPTLTTPKVEPPPTATPSAPPPEPTATESAAASASAPASATATATATATAPASTTAAPVRTSTPGDDILKSRR